MWVFMIGIVDEISSFVDVWCKEVFFVEENVK